MAFNFGPLQFKGKRKKDLTPREFYEIVSALRDYCDYIEAGENDDVVDELRLELLECELALERIADAVDEAKG